MKKYTIAALGLIIAFALVRLFIIGSLGLGDDEAYYWDWSRHLSLSYFDHPPLIAYLIALFVRLGKNTEFFVRLGPLLMFCGSNILLFQISRMLFDEKTGFFSVLILNLIPLFSLGAIVAVPDNPLGFAFLLAMYAFMMAIRSNKDIYWYLWGLSLGLALLSKYNGVILILSFLIYMLVSRDRAKFICKVSIYNGLLIALLLFMPVLIWNYQNHWASFRFQFFSGHRGHFSPENLVLFVLSQAGYLSPIIYALLIWALIGAEIKGIKDGDQKYLLLFWLSAPTLILFHLASPRLSFKPHWTALGYMPLIPVVVQMARERWQKMRIRILAISGLALAFVMTAVIHVQAYYPILRGQAITPKMDVTNELYGWKEVGEQVEKIKKDMPSPVFVFSYRYQLTSQLAFYVPGQPPAYSLNSWLDAYDFFQNSNVLLGENGVFVCDNRFDRTPDEFCRFVFIQQDEDVVINRAGREVRRFHIYRCYDFEGVR